MMAHNCVALPIHFQCAARDLSRPPHRLGVSGRKVAELGVARRARSPRTRNEKEKGAEGGKFVRFVRALQALAAGSFLSHDYG